MKTPTLLKVFGLLLALGGTVHADDLTWTSQFSGSPLARLGFNSGWTTSYSNVFDITANGFDPLNMTIDSAVASFAFADDIDDANDSSSSKMEWVDITLGGNLFIHEEVDGAHPYSSYAWYYGTLGVSLIADLQLDGKLNFKVEILDTILATRFNLNKKEDTYLKVAKLVVKGHENPPHKVPDEANTVLLMGAAMLGLVALRKRFAARA